jgi:propanol-preferring alcohol dehydrogenase
MRALMLRRTRTPLELEERRVPAAAAGGIPLKVRACSVCCTDLHAVDGELPEATLPIVPGHEVIGAVAELGAGRLARE